VSNFAILMALTFQCVSSLSRNREGEANGLDSFPRKLDKLDVQSCACEVHQHFRSDLRRGSAIDFPRPRHPHHAYPDSMVFEPELAEESQSAAHVLRWFVRDCM
jgi:hypothetical protein